MSKRVVRKTITGKQTFKDNSSQTKIPKEQTITRNGPNFLEQGANLLGLTQVNPLIKLGANVIADLCDDNPFQQPVQKITKTNDNPMKQSIEAQVDSVQKEVEKIIQDNVTIREVSYPIVNTLYDTTVKPLTENETTITEKTRWIPTISKSIVFDLPITEEKQKSSLRTIQGKYNPVTFAYNRRQQKRREALMKERKIQPIFPIPCIDDNDNPYKDL